MKQKRYVMGYSHAECGDMVVYAIDYEHAVEKFECGEYTIEIHDSE